MKKACNRTMTTSNMTAAARRHFDQGMAALDADPRAARAAYTEATEIDPSMADAWLGRVAAGDDALDPGATTRMRGPPAP